VSGFIRSTDMVRLLQLVLFVCCLPVFCYGAGFSFPVFASYSFFSRSFGLIALFFVIALSFSFSRLA
jgi:hypothetical protein